MLGWGPACANAAPCPAQTGEYATDEEEEMSPMFPSGEMAIEVFELAENEDTLSPVEMDPEKLVHKFKEVRGGPGSVRTWQQVSPAWRDMGTPVPTLGPPAAPDQTRCH